MVSPLIYGGVVVLAAFVLVFFVPVLYARGRWLKCPACGETFKAPVMDVRTHGVGVSPPYFGRVICPKCNQASRRGRFQSVPAPSVPAATGRVSPPA